jgi:hypothetical protein
MRQAGIFPACQFFYGLGGAESLVPSRLFTDDEQADLRGED